jgi:hypothetical protein
MLRDTGSEVMKNRKHVIFLVLIIFGITACQAERISQTQLKLARYSMEVNDVPQGWIFTGKDWNKEYGGESYLVAYELDNMIGLAHTVSIYPDEESAKNAYKELETREFQVLEVWPGANFIPSDLNDDYKFECQQILSDKSIISCSYLQRHKLLISDVLITFDNDFVSFADINKMLRSVDGKLNSVDMNN